MRQFLRGERAKLADLAAINHIWEVGVSIDAPFFIVDFCCLGLGVNGEVVDERYLINYNQPDAPQGAIALDNASNNGAFFTLYLERLPTPIRRLVFTATLHAPEMPGGIFGAALSMFGINDDIGEGHLTLGTPAVEAGFVPFSGQDFGEASTLVLGEIYWRDEWRFVAAGQPLKGELGAFLRTLADGPTPVPVRPSTSPLSAPARQARIPAPPPVQPPVSVLRSPALTPAPLAGASKAPISPPRNIPTVRQVESEQPMAEDVVSPAIVTPPVNAALPQPASPPVLPQSVAPGGKLQDLIDAAEAGSTLVLMRDEYEGPFTIRKPLVLEGRESALWARVGPVVTIASQDVTLRNLDVEVTTSQEAPGEEGVALKIEWQITELQLDNVRVRGRISGLGAEDGYWELPSLLDVGQFAARADNEFRFSLSVPTEVQISSPVEGVTLSPIQVASGQHQITLTIRDVAPEALIIGYIEVRSQALVRTIPLRGRASQNVPPLVATQL